MGLVPGQGIRQYFPMFSRHTDPPLAFLDTAASSQKPQIVIDRLSQFLAYEHANIHRGAYSLSGEATRNYEAARERVAAFIGASGANSIVFTKGATEAVNLIAYGVESFFKANDRILVSLLEHHSNFVPWQLLAKRQGLQLEFAGINPDASLDLKGMLTQIEKHRPKLVAVTCLSNAFGSVVPVNEVVSAVHSYGGMVVLDAAQAVAHMRLNVTELDCDFMVFSGHKLYGPTGVGVLYGKEELLQRMEPVESGGGMIQSVSKEETLFAEPPHKFEAGTPPIAETIALVSAIDFVSSIGLDVIARHENSLLEMALELLSKEDFLTVYGPGLRTGGQVSIVSFNINGVHPHDLATFADSHNVQIRAGHHCAMPALRELNLSSTARASFGVYSTGDDILALQEAIRQAHRVLG